MGVLDPRLRYVVAVATAGSFTAGAAAAGVTQSTVTKAIADLEREVGYAIFVRSARGVVPTERGSYFAERAKLLLDDMRNLMDPEARRQNAYSGILRVGVAPASIEWVLTEALVRLRRYHPTIKFDVSGTSFDRMIQQLRTEVVDVGIGMSGAFKAWGDLDSGEFGHLEVLPFVRNGHPLLEMEEVRLADLAAYDFISPSESRPYGECIRDLYLSNGVAWQDRVHIIDYFPGVKRLVATSDAIGVIAAPFGQRSGFRAHFTPLRDTGLFPSGPLAYAYHNKREPKPATRAFIAVLKATVMTAGHSR